MITPERASAIAHGGMPFHNPLAERTIDGVVELLALGPNDQVLDVGCGRGELLIRIVEETGARGLGVDSSAEQIELARSEAEARGAAEFLSFELRDAEAMLASAGGFSVVACIGSTHALGGLEPTLARLRELVREGGYLVLGEGYWEGEPSGALLESLGAARDELTSLPELLASGEAHALEVVHVGLASGEDWRRYEWTYVFNLDRYVRDHPQEAGLEQLVDRRDRVRDRRLLAAREGEGLGFALVVWRKR